MQDLTPAMFFNCDADPFSFDLMALLCATLIAPYELNRFMAVHLDNSIYTGSGISGSRLEIHLISISVRC